MVFKDAQYSGRSTWDRDDGLFHRVRLFAPFNRSSMAHYVNARIVLGPPVGGLLYDRFGFRAPFLLGISIALFDLVGRLLIIESKPDPAKCVEPPSIPEGSQAVPATDTIIVSDVQTTSDQTGIAIPMTPRSWSRANQTPDIDSECREKVQLSLWQVLVRLSKSPRALSAMFVMVARGYVAAKLLSV